MFCFIMRHEHIHAIRAEHTSAVCGYMPPAGWVPQSKLFDEVTCKACRDTLQLGQLQLDRTDPQFSSFLVYE
ncbi:hypothetical protein ATO7_12143 [Oceanococcus atlanticus]|uniref:Uncharacterized protein n=1 Tax=Oceanococcus atlanticus TaxID=1317117 RepID=A0A1Y1SCX9_9GAMM|nr:hypothetical protein ATO7_12143 [Oceanococcus atlanticus]